MPLSVTAAAAAAVAAVSGGPGIDRRFRLLRRGAIGLIIGILLLSGGGIIMLRQDAVLHTQGELRRLAVVFAEQTARAIQAADLGLQSILDEISRSGVEDREGMDREFQTAKGHADLVHHTENLPQVDSYSIIGADGRPVNTSRIWPMPDINLSDRSYFQHFLGSAGNTAFVSGPVHSRVNGERTVYLVRRITGPGGSFLGVVSAAIRLGYFDEVFAAAQLEDGAGVALVRGDGTILSRVPVPAGAVVERFPLPAWHAAVQAGGGALRAEGTRLDGRGSRFIHVHPVPGAALVISASWLETAALARWRMQAGTIAASGALGAGLIAALAWLLLRHDRAMQAAHLMVVAHAAEMQASEARLAEASAVLRVTLENIVQGIIMVDASGRVAIANRRAGELLGLPARLLGGEAHFAELARYQRESGEHDALSGAERAMVDTEEVPNHALSYERRRPDGTVIEVNSIPLAGGGMVRTYTDITARAEAEEMLALAASHDHLTGLANRNGFGQRLERMLQAASQGDGRLSLLCLDLDGFKSVNDSHGHEVGDKLLQQVGDRLRQSLREHDLLARMGGDEFAIVLGGQEPAVVTSVAQRLLEAIGRPYEIGGLQVMVGVSIGIVSWPLDGGTAEELLRNADTALYQAKEAGKNRWCLYASEAGDREHRRLALEADLRGALEQGQFSLAYQPICDAETGAPVGFEALLRWNHPLRGAISPTEFIPVAEQTGMIVPLGAWVLATACAEAASWALPARIAVNVSPTQFRDPDFLAHVRASLLRTGLAGERLELELTEGLLLEESETVLRAMHEMRRLGVRMVLDDFGTANSNLSYLRGLPFDAVKIDRSFLRALSSDRQARALVTAILAMAHALELEVVGEGVETAEQLTMLRHLSCDLVQGYLLGKPEPAEAAREWLWKLASGRAEAARPAAAAV